MFGFGPKNGHSWFDRSWRGFPCRSASIETALIALGQIGRDRNGQHPDAREGARPQAFQSIQSAKRRLTSTTPRGRFKRDIRSQYTPSVKDTFLRPINLRWRFILGR